MKMDDLELLNLLKSKESRATQYVQGELGLKRQSAIKAYYREPYGNEQEGWSQIVSSDVQDTVEWLLPQLLKIFTSTDKAVSFEPSRANDVQGAEQATDACNYVFYKQNNGFLILYTAFKEALSSGNCAVTWNKETNETVSSYPFKGATDEMLALMMQEDESELSEVSTETVLDPMGNPVQLHTGRLKRTEHRTIVKVESFSSGDLLIEPEWTSPLLQDCPYVCRLHEVTLSELKQMGFTDVDVKELRASDVEATGDGEYLASIGRLGVSNSEEEDGDDSTALGTLRVEYVLADADGDGIAERLCVYRLADRILKREPVSHVPIATASPLLNPHRWDGMSMHDLVGDLQMIHTEILRQTLDNLKLTNNPRKTVLTDSNWSPLANIDDLLDSRIGGIIRAKQAGAVTDEVVPFTAGSSMPMLDYVQGMRENRTGVSRTSMGLNPDSLNNTATGRQIDMGAAAQRIELIARIFAEILVKPIFLGILKTLTDGQIDKMAFRLRDEFVEYDPNEWRDQYDMTIHVGLGTGDKTAQAASLMQIMSLQREGMALGIVEPKHLYHTFSKMIENAGFKDVQSFAIDPTTQPQKPQQPPMQLQIEQMKLQADKEIEGLKAQIKQAEIAMQYKLQESNDQRDAAREVMKAQNENAQAEQQLEFDKWKTEYDAQVKIYIEEMKLRGVPTSDYMVEQTNLQQVFQGLQSAIESLKAPKMIVRDESGQAIGVQSIQ
jgi:hypothetical protein